MSREKGKSRYGCPFPSSCSVPDWYAMFYPFRPFSIRPVETAGYLVAAAPFSCFSMYDVHYYPKGKGTASDRLDYAGVWCSFSWIFRISASLLLLALGTHTLYETTNWTVSTYLQFTPHTCSQEAEHWWLPGRLPKEFVPLP